VAWRSARPAGRTISKTSVLEGGPPSSGVGREGRHGQHAPPDGNRISTATERLEGSRAGIAPGKNEVMTRRAFLLQLLPHLLDVLLAALEFFPEICLRSGESVPPIFISSKSPILRGWLEARPARGSVGSIDCLTISAGQLPWRLWNRAASDSRARFASSSSAFC